MIDPPWIAEARKYIGVKEIPGPRHHAAILKMWSMIRAPYTDDETPWCAAFVGGCLEASGIRSTRSASSLSYLTFGLPLARPVLGSIAVKKRYDEAGKLVGGHVTYPVAQSPDGSIVLCLGGNQNNAVNVSPYPTGIFKYRWPLLTPPPALQIPVMTASRITATKEA